MPASGLVSALEPILRACDGTWIAHGSGDADRETVDAHDRLGVPLEDPKYILRRVWLSKACGSKGGVEYDCSRGVLMRRGETFKLAGNPPIGWMQGIV